MVVDPMHNLLLGVSKTQWFTRWIQGGALRGNTPGYTRELDIVHQFLESFESPLWAGRLPLRIGEAAGGSLTADEYKFAVTGPWAVVIPLVWERFLEEAEKEYKAASTHYPKALKEYEKKKKAWERGNKAAAAPKPPKKPVCRMQRGEDENFLHFATFLKVLVGSSIRIEGLERAKLLLQEYLLGYSKLYGADEMKPNHHWAVHVPDEVLDYGPLYSFWAFLTERLNKLEASMMREFNRMAQLNGILSGIMDETAGDALPLELQLEHGFINLLFGDDEAQEALGTIQDAAFHERTMTQVSAGTVSVRAELIEDDALRMALISYYKWKGFNVYLTRNRPQGEGTQMLGSYTETYDYALLDGRRITSTTRSKRLSAGSSIIQIHFDDVSEGSGEVRST
ncbi:hypothetical protein C8J57DRAFT_1721647 [Mycena rebaudengoi]|nr:hypothetical protein C8J57DRAFT_1721647 [Mycena rebaudengoi]